MATKKKEDVAPVTDTQNNGDETTLEESPDSRLKNLWHNLPQAKKLEVLEKKKKEREAALLLFQQCQEELVKLSKILNTSDLDVIVPATKVFDDEERLQYYRIINMFISDFKLDDLSKLDIDDIVQLALNRVLEVRLLAASRSHPKDILDISSSIEKIHKHSEKLREGLSSRRSDRLDPKMAGSFSIVHLASAYDAKRRMEMEKLDDHKQLSEQKFLEEKAAREALRNQGTDE